MLHSYAFSNFQSFRERVEVDLTLSRKTRQTDWMVEVQTGELVSKLMAVIGPNGSGKTALLKPAAFIGWFVSASFQGPTDAGIPVVPHFAAADQASEFECVFDWDDKLWRYVLRCTPQRVIHEALYLRKERYNYVFVRDWNEKTGNYIGGPVHEVTLSRAWYGEWMGKYISLFEDGFITMPRDASLEDDHRAVEYIDGIPMVLETINPDIWAEEIAWLKAQQTAEQAA